MCGGFQSIEPLGKHGVGGDPPGAPDRVILVLQPGATAEEGRGEVRVPSAASLRAAIRQQLPPGRAGRGYAGAPGRVGGGGESEQVAKMFGRERSNPGSGLRWAKGKEPGAGQEQGVAGGPCGRRRRERHLHRRPQAWQRHPLTPGGRGDARSHARRRGKSGVHRFECDAVGPAPAPRPQKEGGGGGRAEGGGRTGPQRRRGGGPEWHQR